MRNFTTIILLLTLLPCLSVQAQSAEGSWEGVLDVMGTKLPLVFSFEQKDEIWSGFMDSPSQGAKDIPLTKVLFEDNLLLFEHSAANITFEGILLGDQISGTFKQGGMSFPLALRKRDTIETDEIIKPLRPQTPQAPFPYESKDVSFPNEEVGLNIYGTLTIPEGEGPFPTIILVTGSGPQDRNSTIFDHQSFWVLADFFSKNGVMVLRYDERGVGESDGDFASATSEDFKNDAQHAISYLKTLEQVDTSRIGVLGHSEGGMIAWMMAAEQKKQPLDFIISLAAPVVNIPELMKKQTEDISRSSGSPKALVERQVEINSKFYRLIKDSDDKEMAMEALPALVQEIVAEYDVSDEIRKQQEESLLTTFEKSINPWFVYFMKYEPEVDIKKIEIPVFAAFGVKDLQVNAAQNGNRLIELFEGKDELLRLKVYEDLNHLFQKADTGAISEYQQIEETFNQKVMDDISGFIKAIK